MRERVSLSRLGDQIQYPLGVLSELIGNFRFIPVLPLGQYLDDLIAGCGAEQDGEEEMAVVYNVNHERLHLGIADPVMEIFKFAVAETEMRHELRQAFSCDLAVLQFIQLIGAHKIAEDGRLGSKRTSGPAEIFQFRPKSI